MHPLESVIQPFSIFKQGEFFFQKTVILYSKTVENLLRAVNRKEVHEITVESRVCAVAAFYDRMHVCWELNGAQVEN